MEVGRDRLLGNLQNTDLVLWNKASSSESPSLGAQTLREGDSRLAEKEGEGLTFVRVN